MLVDRGGDDLAAELLAALDAPEGPQTFMAGRFARWLRWGCAERHVPILEH
jgi:hypothetical protein